SSVPVSVCCFSSFAVGGGRNERFLGKEKSAPPPIPSPARGRAVRGTEVGCSMAALLNRKCVVRRFGVGDQSPSPPFRGEREGPGRDRAGEGEVGSAANRFVGSPHPALSPRPAGGEGKMAGRSGRKPGGKRDAQFAP